MCRFLFRKRCRSVRAIVPDVTDGANFNVEFATQCLPLLGTATQMPHMPLEHMVLVAGGTAARSDNANADPFVRSEHAWMRGTKHGRSRTGSRRTSRCRLYEVPAGEFFLGHSIAPEAVGSFVVSGWK